MAAEVTSLLAELAAAGVSLAAEKNNLVLRHKGRATPEQVARIKALKPQLLEHFSTKPTPPGTDVTDRSSAPEPVAASSVPREVSSPVRAAGNEFLDIVESWTTPAPDRAPTMDAFGITRVVVIPPVDPEKEPGIFAHVVVVLGGALVVRGIVAHRSISGHVSVRYPQVLGSNGKKIDVLKTLSPGAARDLEQRILSELHGKGFLLAQLESAPEGEAT